MTRSAMVFGRGRNTDASPDAAKASQAAAGPGQKGATSEARAEPAKQPYQPASIESRASDESSATSLGTRSAVSKEAETEHNTEDNREASGGTDLERQSTNGDNIILSFAEDDPENPYNWSSVSKPTSSLNVADTYDQDSGRRFLSSFRVSRQ